MLWKWRVWFHSLTSVVMNFRMVISNISIDHENVKTYIMESPEGDLLWVQRIMRYDNYIASALIWAVLKFVFVKLVSKEIVEVTTSDLMQIFYDVWIIERDSLNSVKATTHCPLNASWRDRVAKKTCTSQRKSLWKRN